MAHQAAGTTGRKVVMKSGVLSLRGRIGLRGWGITTRAPRRLSNRHWLGQLCVPSLRGGSADSARSSITEHALALVNPINYHANDVIIQRAKRHPLSSRVICSIESAL